MTVIRPNSISGITSITAQANEINVFRSNGLIAGLNLNGVNFNTTAGISTLAALKITGNLDVEGVLTYQDVTNVDSLGIGTFRTGINVSGGQLDVGSNIKLGNAGVITATSLDISGDIDVDGHTNLDNVSIVGVTTFNGLSTNDVIRVRAADTNGISVINILAEGTTGHSRIKFSDTAGTDGQISYTHTDRALTFATAGTTETLRLDSSGHMGLGVTPSAWPDGDFRAFQLGTGACIFGRGSGDEDRGGIAVNYYHSSGDKYIANGHGSRIYMADGHIYLQNAASNSSGAGAAMTLLTRLQVDATDGHVDFTGSTSSTLGYVFQNGTSGSSADTRVLIKSYANGGGDPYLKFDAGGQDMVVGTSYAGTTNNLLCLGPGSVPSINNNGLRINGLGKTLLSYLAPGQDSIIDLQNKRTRANGHMYGIDFRDSSNESNANIVIQQNSSGNNAAHMRFYVSPGTGGNGITNGNLVMSLEQGNSVNVYNALRTNRIEPFNGLPSSAFGGIIQVKWSANVDNANYSSGSDVVMQTVNITPTNSSARILIHVCYPSIRSYTTGNTRNRLNQHIKRNGSEIYSLPEMPQWRGANFASSGVEINKNVNFVTIDSPNTTSQVTYTATWSSVDGHTWNTASAQMTMICAELTGY